MIQVIERVFTVLEELSLDGEVSLEALAKVSTLNKATLCNILRTLIELGYVQRSRPSHYCLSERFHFLVQRETIPADELDTLRSAVFSLAEETEESGVLATLRGERIAVVTQAQYPRTIMVNTHEIYAALSLYHSVSGRILVACLPAEERRHLCQRVGFPKGQWDGIGTFTALEEVCANIRRDQLSVMENPQQEIVSFAVPVTRLGRIFSLGLTMPLPRCPSRRRREIISCLRKCALSISK